MIVIYGVVMEQLDRSKTSFSSEGIRKAGLFKMVEENIRFGGLSKAVSN